MFEVELNFAKICWTRNAPGTLNENGEICKSASENRKISFTFDEPCSDEARKKQSSGYILCPPIFFRIEGKVMSVPHYKYYYDYI